MNQFVIECRACGTFSPRLDNRQNSIAEGSVEIPPAREDDPWATLAIVAYGKTADTLLAAAAGQVLRLEGAIKIERDQPPVLNVERASLLRDLPNAALSLAVLVGRAGRDPEAQYFDSGNCVAKFSLAVNRRSRDDAPDWFNLEIWGKQAQVAADYVQKGSQLAVIGSFKVDRWTDRTTGEERTKPVIKVDRFEFVGSRRDAEQAPAPATGGPL
jgi:single-strand DNA-binding protein